MTQLPDGQPSTGLKRGRTIALALLMAFYLTAGIIHVWKPQAFMPVMPDWVPSPWETIIVTGLCEVAGVIGLGIARFRKLAGVMLALYAVCVFPVNIKHALHDLGTGTGLGWGYHGPRLLLQPVIVWWALFASGVTWWPFGRKRRAP